MKKQAYNPIQQRYTPPKYPTPGKPTAYDEGENGTVAEAIKYLQGCVDQDAYEKWTEGDNGEKIFERHEAFVNMPNAGGMAIYLGIHKTTLYDWAKAHEEFNDIIEFMNAIREDRLTNGGLSGKYQQTLTALMLARHGYAKQIEITNPDGSMRPMAPMSLTQLEALANAEIAKDAETANDHA